MRTAHALRSWPQAFKTSHRGKLKSRVLHHDTAMFHRSLLESNYLSEDTFDYFHDQLILLISPHDIFSPSSDEEFTSGATTFKFRSSAATKTLEDTAKSGL
ncbi:hypothetical protein AVEN_241741-1 [Araneus ventricosus]|uniref:Uncharacterized protein n=1 Tax=Araneus ventricosus TaxID=182803 RepID=A0A4Y2GTV4_ARAVE|nr:hypothetical protein AVEN_241741-1 [Araneus ventricosus]